MGFGVWRREIRNGAVRCICVVKMKSERNTQVSQYLVNQWDGETVSDCIAIELPVVIHPSWQDVWVGFWDGESTVCHRAPL